MLDRLTLQRLRDLPIEQVAERVGLHVERHKSLCPFHDDHRPSLTYHARSNTFRCFSCGARGGPIDLVMGRLGMSFPEACRWLDGDVRIDPLPLSRPRPREEAYKPFDAARYARFFEHPWLSAPARQFIFQERRLDPRVVAWCRLTSWTDRHGTHWLQTPYYDPQMRLVGLQNRNLDYKKSAPAEAQTTSRATSGMVSQTDDRTSSRTASSSEPMAQPRFRFPQGSRCGLYNQPVLLRLRPGEPLWITEGCSDCWAMLSSGHKAVAIPSATTLHDAEVRLLLDLHDRHALPHVSRRRCPGRAPLPAAARPAAGTRPPPSAPGLQGLLRLLSLHQQNHKVIMNETPIRAYSKQELAQTYFPDIAPRSAVNRLRAWIDRCQPLSQALHEAGYRKTSKWFTPHEVRLIVHYLGDP